MKRIVLAGILGGLTLFVWMFVAHELLGLGEMGVGEIPNEAVVLSARSNSRSRLLYLSGLRTGAKANQRAEKRSHAGVYEEV
jgi:hypothetical protein